MFNHTRSCETVCQSHFLHSVLSLQSSLYFSRGFGASLDAIKVHKSQHGIEINQPFIINTSQCLLSKGLFIVLQGAGQWQGARERAAGGCVISKRRLVNANGIKCRVRVQGCQGGVCWPRCLLFRADKAELDACASTAVSPSISLALPLSISLCVLLSSSLSKSHYLLIRIASIYSALTRRTHALTVPEERSFICWQLKDWNDWRAEWV